MTRWILWIALLGAAAFQASAQQAARDTYIQVEARPSEAQALDRADAYSQRLQGIGGYRMTTGWYAIAIGPFSREVAEAQLEGLRASGQIPSDSYLTSRATYSQQFWPPGTTFEGAPALSGEAANTLFLRPGTSRAEATAPATAQEPDETRGQALSSERLLTRADREDLQNALAWEGTYAAAVDGDFGPATRRAIETWQRLQGFPATGVLTSAQRRGLLNAYRDAVEDLGLATLEDAQAGISLTAPGNRLNRAESDPPFVRYEDPAGGSAQLILISQTGDSARLTALYEVLQTLRVVPVDGPRRVRRDSFDLEGRNDSILTLGFARLSGDEIKGALLVWPQEDERTARLVYQAMQTSFAPMSGQVLGPAGSSEDQSVDLLAGLEIRQPVRARSGFFVDNSGRVLTTTDAIRQCQRITIDQSTDMSVEAENATLGLALLAPRAAIAPVGFARFRENPGRIRSEIAVAGYSYGGRLGAPSLTYGELQELASLEGDETQDRLQISPGESDAGGPVLDTSGSVVGLLRPGPVVEGRRLPDDLHYSTDSVAILEALSANGLQLSRASAAEPLAPEDLASLASDMTVLVNCWN